MPHAPARSAAAAQSTFAARCSDAARACGGTTLALTAFVLVAWAARLPSVTSVNPGLPAMVPSTAIALAASGLALWLMQARVPAAIAPATHIATIVLAALPLLLGVLTLAQHIPGLDLSIDTVLLPAWYASDGFLGRPLLTSALNLALLGTALLLLKAPSGHLIGLAQLVVLLAALNGLRALLGLIQGESDSYVIADMSGAILPTAVVFLVMGGGVLCARPREGIMQVVSSPGYGGKIFRRLLPAAVLLPLLIGAATIRGGRQTGRFDVGLGMIVLTFAYLLVFWWLARALNRSEGTAAREGRRAQALLELADRRTGRLQALRRVDIATIHEHQAFGVMLDVLLDQTRAQLGVDAAAVLLAQPGRDTLGHARRSGFHTSPRTISAALDTSYLGLALRKRRATGSAGSVPQAPLPAHAADEGFVAGYAAPMVVEGQITGVLEVGHRSPLALDAEAVSFLETLAGQGAIALATFRLFTDLERSNEALMQAYDETLAGWSYALELRDGETQGHTQRVTELTLRLAEAFGMKGEELTQIRRGAMLHDIGKLGVPDSILLKPSRLTDEEWALMRQHPVYAYQWLRPITYLWAALAIPYCHHERWDGTGYPRGLKGEEIPLEARIFAVVDVWDALCSERPYHPPWPAEDVRAYIAEQAGSHFDPQVVEVFLRIVGDGDVQQAREAGK